MLSLELIIMKFQTTEVIETIQETFYQDQYGS